MTEDDGATPVTLAQAREDVVPASRWRQFGRVVSLFLAHAIGTANIALILAIAPALQKSLDLSHAGFGMAIAAYHAAMVVGALPAGWLIDRIGIRAALILAHFFLASGMFVIARAGSFGECAAGLGLCGTGYVLVNPATARAVLLWFPRRGRATAMGLKQTGVPIGGIAAALVVTLGGQPWRELALGVVAITIVMGIGFVFLRTPTLPRARGTMPLRDIRQLFGRPRLASLNGAACIYSAAQSTFFAYLVLFVYTNLGLDAAAASLCLGLAYAASALGRVGWGIMSDLLRNGRKVSLLVCGFVGATGLLLMSFAPGDTGIGLPAALALVLGLTLGGNASLAQTAAVEAVEPRLAGASIGYNMLLITTGSMIGPALFGVTLDFAGYKTAWLGLGAALLLGAALVTISFERPLPVSTLDRHGGSNPSINPRREEE